MMAVAATAAGEVHNMRVRKLQAIIQKLSLTCGCCALLPLADFFVIYLYIVPVVYCETFAVKVFNFECRHLENSQRMI
jgi:hypothetical protein